MFSLSFFLARSGVRPSRLRCQLMMSSSLSEFYRTSAKGKLESTRPKMTDYPSDSSPILPDQEFVELLWENGQIVMQGQSNRRKNSFPAAMSSHTSKFREKDNEDAVISKIGQFGEPDSMLKDYVPSVPSGIGLNAHDDDMAPWLNYPEEESLQNDYCLEFLSESSGANLISLSSHNTTMPDERTNGLGLTVGDLRSVEDGHASKNLGRGSEASRIRPSQLFQVPRQSSALNTRQRGTEFCIAGSSSTIQDPYGNLLGRSLQKQDTTMNKTLQPSISMGVVNFSHFARPVAMVKSNLQNVDRLRINEKTSTAASSNPVESTAINNCASGLKTLFVSLSQRVASNIPPEVEFTSSVKPPPQEEVASVAQLEAVCEDEASRNKHVGSTPNINTRLPDHVTGQSSSPAASLSLPRTETEKGSEAIVASSSVFSVSTVCAESKDLEHSTKRKRREGQELGCQSEDHREQSVGLKMSAAGRGAGAKRSRAAEVHNLSERRRRDRINEKMRALQELVPNCNKVDKASMLDEAIEYLKTLQLQVQIMSMGSGLCMPPMMLPAAMQHLCSPPMAHFSPMGATMGMGFGMGMLNMNSTPGCPMVPVSSVHGPQFPCSLIPGVSSLHGMPGSRSLQMLGVPGQGFPVSMSHAQLFGSLSGLSTEAKATPTPLPVVHAAPSLKFTDKEQENMKLEINAASTSFEQSAMAQMGNQTLHGNGN